MTGQEPTRLCDAYCSFRYLGFWGLLGFLIRQLRISFMATLLSAAQKIAPYPKPFDDPGGLGVVPAVCSFSGVLDAL